MTADPPEPDLHLIGDGHAARGTDPPVDAVEISGRQDDLAAAGQDRLRQERTHRGSGPGQIADGVVNERGVSFAEIRGIAPIEAAILIGLGHFPHPG